MEPDISREDAGRAGRRGRWGTLTGVLSGLSLIMCAAFAEQAARRLGAPSALVIYGVVGVAGLLVAAVMLGGDLNGISRSGYKWLARCLAGLMIALTGYMCLFVIVDSRGGTLEAAGRVLVVPPTPTVQVVISMVLFVVPCLGALVSLSRLVASAGASPRSVSG